MSLAGASSTLIYLLIIVVVIVIIFVLLKFLFGVLFIAPLGIDAHWILNGPLVLDRAPVLT